MLTPGQDVAIACQSEEEAHRLAILRRIRLVTHVHWWDGDGMACISADCIVERINETIGSVGG